ncbi:MAG: RNA 2'-phosphotransferase, partial [Akkermansiaceae bacterium]|nr:RNA 2'-phosphotransferase [Akkermansiaceae bacterium]
MNDLLSQSPHHRLDQSHSHVHAAMNPQHAVNISRFLSLVLRHKPETIGISLSEEGWINVDDLIAAINL